MLWLLEQIDWPVPILPGLKIVKWYWTFDADGMTFVADGIRIVCDWFAK